MKIDYQKKLDEILLKIKDKKKKPKLLLHVCCGPCSSYVLEYLSKFFDITIYFYNPNIEPHQEFDIRVNEVKRLINEMPLEGKIDIVIEEYNNKEFKEAIRGYEKEKEGGMRCFKCYNLRMEKAAIYAKKNKFNYFTTTLSISPYKNASKLNEIGEELEKKHKIKYLYADFKKKNGYKRSIELSKIYNLYRQDYCGCIYSKIEAEERKKKKEVKNNISDIMTNKKTNKNTDFKENKSDYNFYFSFIYIIILIFLIASGFLIYNYRGYIKYNFYKMFGKTNNENMTYINDNNINIEKENYASILEYYYYGNHFNLIGDLKINTLNISDINFVLVGNNYQYTYDIDYKITSDGIKFLFSDKLNGGINLRNINIDTYICYIELILDNDKIYYHLENKTDYDTTTYYTITENNNNKKLNFYSSDNNLKLDVTLTNDETYDIVIDPGHGGSDKGACFNKLCETDLTLTLSNDLKEKLEKYGYKVALTREIDETLEKYGEDGRVERSYKTKAKMLLSIHLNSSSMGYEGFEIYTSNNINYEFAKKLIEEINKTEKIVLSNNTSFRVEPGIYTRTFNSTDVNNINSLVETPYPNVSTNTNYYFMIREVGGYMAGAYADGQTVSGENIYRNSNIGLESYILELGYINRTNDTENITNNKEIYISAIAKAINNYLIK